MTPDHELLRQYLEENAESAFTELVHRNVDLVYSVALRMVNGDRQLAEDVVQRIFAELARRAHYLSGRPTLAGWLHVSSRNAAIDIVRRERRRQAREQEACLMNEPPTVPDVNWEQLRPVLDEAVAWLKESDRDAVVLRFFQGKSHREIGEALGLNENTARMRVDRALEKLRTYFSRRGVTVSSALLATAISANAVQAAPAGLAIGVAGHTLAGTGAAASGSLIKTLTAATNIKLAAAAAVIIAAVTASTVSQQKEIAQLNKELGSVHQNPSAHSALTLNSYDDRLRRLLQIAGKNGRSSVETTEDLFPVLASLKVPEIPRLLEMLGKLPKTSASTVVKVALLGNWAESDPAAALQWAKAQANDPNRGDYFLSVLMTLSNKDLAAAWLNLNQVDNAATREKIAANLLARMTDQNPASALEALLKLPVGQRSKMLYEAVFLSWTEKDPAGAAAAALQLPASVARATVLATVAATWGQQDPAAALAWANNLPANAAHTTAIDEVIKALGASDPAAATSYLSNLPNGSQRNKLIADLATSWAAIDAPAALAWADASTSGQAHDQAIEAILTQISQTDPASAAAYLDKVSAPNIRKIALPQLAKEWAQSDIQGALAWVQSLPVSDGTARSTAFQNVLDTWIQSDPVSAATYVQTMTTDPNFQTIATQVAKSWATTDPAAATKWTEGLPPGNIRDSALLSALSSYASLDPKAAWDTATALPEDDYGQNRLRFLSSIAAIWSDTDPAQAAQLLDALPSHNTQGVSAAMGVTAGNWLNQDPAAALQWINSLPPSGARDRAIAQVVTIEGQNDLATAFKWARSIQLPGPVRKGTLVDDIVVEWARKDPAAATAAIEAEPTMNGARRSQLLNLVKQNAPNLSANSPSANNAETPAQ